MNKYEELARKYIEGTGGLFDLYKYEMASPLYSPKEVEGAAWILKCLTVPENRTDLEALVNQSNLRKRQEMDAMTSDYRKARGVLPWKLGMPLPEEAVRRGR